MSFLPSITGDPKPADEPLFLLWSEYVIGIYKRPVTIAFLCPASSLNGFNLDDYNPFEVLPRLELTKLSIKIFDFVDSVEGIVEVNIGDLLGLKAILKKKYLQAGYVPSDVGIYFNPQSVQWWIQNSKEVLSLKSTTISKQYITGQVSHMNIESLVAKGLNRGRSELSGIEPTSIIAQEFVDSLVYLEKHKSFEQLSREIAERLLADGIARYLAPRGLDGTGGSSPKSEAVSSMSREIADRLLVDGIARYLALRGSDSGRGSSSRGEIVGSMEQLSREIAERFVADGVNRCIAAICNPTHSRSWTVEEVAKDISQQILSQGAHRFLVKQGFSEDGKVDAQNQSAMMCKATEICEIVVAEGVNRYLINTGSDISHPTLSSMVQAAHEDMIDHLITEGINSFVLRDSVAVGDRASSEVLRHLVAESIESHFVNRPPYAANFSSIASAQSRSISLETQISNVSSEQTRDLVSIGVNSHLMHSAMDDSTPDGDTKGNDTGLAGAVKLAAKDLMEKLVADLVGRFIGQSCIGKKVKDDAVTVTDGSIGGGGIVAEKKKMKPRSIAVTLPPIQGRPPFKVSIPRGGGSVKNDAKTEIPQSSASEVAAVPNKFADNALGSSSHTLTQKQRARSVSPGGISNGVEDSSLLESDRGKSQQSAKTRALSPTARLAKRRPKSSSPSQKKSATAKLESRDSESGERAKQSNSSVSSMKKKAVVERIVDGIWCRAVIEKVDFVGKSLTVRFLGGEKDGEVECGLQYGDIRLVEFERPPVIVEQRWEDLAQPPIAPLESSPSFPGMEFYSEKNNLISDPDLPESVGAFDWEGGRVEAEAGVGVVTQSPLQEQPEADISQCDGAWASAAASSASASASTPTSVLSILRPGVLPSLEPQTPFSSDDPRLLRMSEDSRLRVGSSSSQLQLPPLEISVTTAGEDWDFPSPHNPPLLDMDFENTQNFEKALREEEERERDQTVTLPQQYRESSADIGECYRLEDFSSSSQLDLSSQFSPSGGGDGGAGYSFDDSAIMSIDCDGEVVEVHGLPPRKEKDDKPRGPPSERTARSIIARARVAVFGASRSAKTEALLSRKLSKTEMRLVDSPFAKPFPLSPVFFGKTTAKAVDLTAPKFSV